MSKYGFNENEVKKTMITKVDKDGFHKQEVFERNIDVSSFDFTYATMTVEENAVNYMGPAIFDNEDVTGEPPSATYMSGSVTAEESPLMIPLYKGLATVYIQNLNNCTVSGDADIDPDVEGSLHVHGDFTIVGPNE